METQTFTKSIEVTQEARTPASKELITDESTIVGGAIQTPLEICDVDGIEFSIRSRFLTPSA